MKKPRKNNCLQKAAFYIFFTAVIAEAVLIFYLSAQNAAESGAESGGILIWLKTNLNIYLSDGFIRTAAHFCEFALFGFLLSGMIFSKVNYLRPFFASFIALLYAVSDEIHQVFVPGRAFQIIDITVDFSGAALGCAAFTVIILIIKQRRERKNPDA